jgi:predicted Zn-dependent peptidase
MKSNFKRHVLENGFTILFERRNIPVVSMAIAVRNGGINEEAHEKGISHFIEHMLYKGTKNRTAKKIAEDIEKNGGVLNGFTSEEITVFHCKMPSKHTEIGLEVLSDMMNNSLFSEEEFEKERKVIFEELKMRRDSPHNYVFDKIQNILYEPPFGNDLIGTIETMNSITREKMVERFNNVYTSDNMVLCVVGDYEFDKLIKFAEENFSEGEKKEFVSPVVLKNDQVTEEREGVDQANLVFTYHSPTFSEEKSYAATVLSTIMGGGMSSRLFAEIREKRNLCYSVHATNHVSKDFAYSYVYVGTTKEKLEEVKGLIIEEFKKVAEGLEENELNEVKEQLIGNSQISMEDSQSQMVSLLLSEICGDVTKYYDFEENISKVKIEDVKELAKKVSQGDYSFFALVPKDN